MPSIPPADALARANASCLKAVSELVSMARPVARNTSTMVRYSPNCCGVSAARRLASIRSLPTFLAMLPPTFETFPLAFSCNADMA